jgi:CBS domain-containing protein
MAVAILPEENMTQRQMSDIVRHQSPLALPPTTTVKDACRKMAERRVGAVLVIKDRKLVGIFTGRDAVARVLAEGCDAEATSLGQVMTTNPTTVAPGCTAIECLRLMQDCGFRHVPVVSRDGALVGVVSRGDFRGHEQDRLDEETGLWERIG